MYTPGLEVSTAREVESSTFPPGLEKATDHKQSYIPGPELHPSDRDKHLQEHSPTQWQTLPTNSMSASYKPCDPAPKPSQTNQHRATPKQKTWLIGTIATLIVTIIIAASVTGVLVSRKRHSDQVKCVFRLLTTTTVRLTSDLISIAPAPATSSSTPPSATVTSAAISPPTPFALISPTSDCSTLNTTYNVPANFYRAVNAAVQFNIRCGYDFNLPLVMAMRTFAFEDCINACASHATNAQSASMGCVAAIYKPNSGQPLTCWLKSIGDANAGVPKEGVDAALVGQL